MSTNNKEYLDYPYPISLPPENDYGYPFPEGVQQYQKELLAYRFAGKVHGYGFKTPFFHLCNAIRLNWPEYIEFSAGGIINTEILRLIWFFCEHRDLGIAGAASTGKTRPIAACIKADWDAAPDRTLSFVCTTTMGASDDRIWGAIVQLHNRAKHQVGEVIDYKKMIVWGGYTDDDDREYNNAIKAVAIDQGQDGLKAIETMRGRKNQRVRLVYDELPEMGKKCLDARINLAVNPDLRFVGIGNPMKKDDAHGELCRPLAGWDSVSKDTPDWPTRTGHCIFLNGEWTANFSVPEDQPIPFPYLNNRKSLKIMLDAVYGNKNSVEYWRNAIGFWPGEGNETGVLSKELIKLRGAHLPAKWRSAKFKTYGTLDPGFTAGGDKCVATFARKGELEDGRAGLEYQEQRQYDAEVGIPFEDSIAKQFVNDLIARKVIPEQAGIDISSDGGKIYAAAVLYWSLDPELEKKGQTRKDAAKIVPISSMGKASDRIVSAKDPRKSYEVYDRRVTEYWMQARQGVNCQVIFGLPIDSDCVEQLCKREYYAKKGNKYEIEIKKDMKKRVGRSPDNADSFVYVLEMARRDGLSFITPLDYRNMMRRRVADAQRNEFTRRGGQLSLNDRTRKVTSGYDDGSWGED